MTKKWRKRNLERSKETTKSYRKLNKNRVIAWLENRRARIKSAKGTFTFQDIEKIYHNQQGLCFYCKEQLDNIYHIDHKIPISREGTNEPENLCCACSSCNLKKHTKTDTEFLAKNSGG